MGEIVIKYAQRVFWIFVDREKLENFVVIYRNILCMYNLVDNVQLI